MSGKCIALFFPSLHPLFSISIPLSLSRLPLVNGKATFSGNTHILRVQETNTGLIQSMRAGAGGMQKGSKRRRSLERLFLRSSLLFYSNRQLI